MSFDNLLWDCGNPFIAGNGARFKRNPDVENMSNDYE